MVYEYYEKNPAALVELRAPIFEDKVVDHILERPSRRRAPALTGPNRVRYLLARNVQGNQRCGLAKPKCSRMNWTTASCFASRKWILGASRQF